MELTPSPLAKKAAVEGPLGTLDSPVSKLLRALGSTVAASAPVIDGVGTDLVVALPLTGANIEAPADIVLPHVLPRHAIRIVPPFLLLSGSFRNGAGAGDRGGAGGSRNNAGTKEGGHPGLVVCLLQERLNL